MVNIDEQSHIVLPTNRERLAHAMLSVGLGFLLVQIIGFWLFPGLGLAALGMVIHSAGASHLNTVIAIFYTAFLVICALVGWFSGEQFIRRLKRYVSWWRFW